MFFRRYILGLTPLLIWAEDEDAADIVAIVHAATLLVEGESVVMARQWQKWARRGRE
jgi:hypothetical protein